MRLSRVHPDSWTTGELIGALYDGAEGDRQLKAAVMLIESHLRWLERTEFLECVDADWEDDVMRVSVNWIGLGMVTSRDAGDEVAVLHIAASIASLDVQVAIGHALSQLSPASSYRALASLAYAAGHRLVLGEAP